MFYFRNRMVSFVVFINCFIDYHHNYMFIAVSYIWSFWGIAKECQEIQFSDTIVQFRAVAEAQVFENKRHQLKNLTPIQ